MMKASFKQIDIDHYDKWITRKRNRITRRNKNWLVLICGDTGSSKSWSGAKICQDIDPTFVDDIKEHGIQKRVAVGNSQHFIDILKDAKRGGGLRRGNMIMFDEAGVSISSRNWFEDIQKDLMFVLQSFRHLNLGVIFTTPDLSFVDSQARKLFHTYLDALDINFKTNRAILKPFELQRNSYEGKTYKKYPIIGGRKIQRFFIAKPHKDFIKYYEPAKDVLTERLLNEADENQKLKDRKKEHKRITDRSIMKTIKEKGLELNAYTLQFTFDIGKDRAYRIINNYEKFSPTIE